MNHIHETPIFVNGMNIVLKFEEFGDEINVDNLTRIHYENIYGEAVTVSALLNRIGILRADAESEYERKKLEYNINEASFRRKIRRESNNSGGKVLISEKPEQYVKFTEKALDEMVLLDEGLQVSANNVIKAKEVFSKLDSMFWAISSKDKKLNNIIKQVTPEEFQENIVEGKINEIMIRKHIPIQERKLKK